jgi:hypothetical protein
MVLSNVSKKELCYTQYKFYNEKCLDFEKLSRLRVSSLDKRILLTCKGIDKSSRCNNCLKKSRVSINVGLDQRESSVIRLSTNNN